MNKQLNVTVQYLHSYEPKCIKITFGDGILACMSRDFDIFMSKHLAGQWLLNSYKPPKNKGISTRQGESSLIFSSFFISSPVPSRTTPFPRSATPEIQSLQRFLFSDFRKTCWTHNQPESDRRSSRDPHQGLTMQT